jgi:transposase
LIPPGLHVEQVLPASDRITIVVTARQTTADCPTCQRTSGNVHSRYQRRLLDLPWQGRPVSLLMQARRFRCPNTACPRQTFTERVEGAVAAAARRTGRLEGLQRQVALTAGGEAGSRLARRLAMPASPDTMLRLIAKAHAQPRATPRILGVDDWALRRGHRYGTVLVDLDRHEVVDLLPDRQAGTLAAWLKRHPGVEVVARDRGGAYADGVRSGAPDARQVADRWHMLRNLGDAMRSAVEQHHTAIRRCARQVAAAIASEPSEDIPLTCMPRPTALERSRKAAYALRQARHDEAMGLLASGMPLSLAAAQMGIDRRTLQRWQEVGHAPWRERRPSGSILDPFREHLERRWSEGCGNARQLWRELVALGFAGSPTLVRTWTGRRRKADAAEGRASPKSAAKAPQWRPPSVYKLTRMLTSDLTELRRPDRLLCEMLLEQEPDLAAAVRAARRLAALLRKEETGNLADALGAMAGTPLARLGESLGRDAAAIQSALDLPWTTSPVEGHVNRIKMLKRAMYGRAGFHLLRQRVLLAA